MFQPPRPAVCGVTIAPDDTYRMMAQMNRGERVLQRDDEMWTVREMSAVRVPGSRGDYCLICESTTVVRRLWEYPDDWMSLSDAELLALCTRVLVPR